MNGQLVFMWSGERIARNISTTDPARAGRMDTDSIQSILHHRQAQTELFFGCLLQTRNVKPGQRVTAAKATDGRAARYLNSSTPLVELPHEKAGVGFFIGRSGYEFDSAILARGMVQWTIGGFRLDTASPDAAAAAIHNRCRANWTNTRHSI